MGCFAMTDPVVEEIYLLAEAALRGGQPSFPVHVFPFRMNEERMKAAYFNVEHRSFWDDLHAGYRKFENTHLPPVPRVVDVRYQFD